MDRTNENANQEKIDRWLDAALAHYSEDEPRAGLEGRILATLEADQKERAQQSSRWPWRLMLAAGLAVVLMVVTARAPWPAKRETIATPQKIATGVPAGTQPKPQPRVVVAATSNRAANNAPTRHNMRPLIIVSEAPAPRLAQFPAPRPLSEQERLLVALVDNSSPEQLAQDADLQQRLRKEVEEAQLSGGGMLEPRGK